VPTPDCDDCLRAVHRSATKTHPRELPIELRKQTENKLDVLADYYAAWPNTILSGLKRLQLKKPVDLWIIDLFAGRGWHESQKLPEGRRPGTATTAGFRLWQSVSRTDWPFEVRGHLVAVDADKEFEASLHVALDRFGHAHMDVEVIPENCAEVIEDIRRRSAGGYTLWLFDPYGLESIPFCLVRPLFTDSRTEIIVNLDAGDALRIVDKAAKAAKTHDLSRVHSPTMDCLFDGDLWRALPSDVPTTARRERWLADRYAELFPSTMLSQALALESSTGYTRFLVQAASHKTAQARFKQSYDDVQRPWKRARGVATVEEMARHVARELAGQTVTPEVIQAIGLFPTVSLERIVGACQRAFALELASRYGPDGTIAILPLEEQPGAPKGLFG
jgi:three-Cys-motif partner protein